MKLAILSLTDWQLAVLFLPALLNLWGIWHAFRHVFSSPVERMLWIGLCIFVPFLGGIAYLLFGLRRSQKRP